MMILTRMEVPGILIFSLGFGLKFFHIPHNAVLMLLGLLCLLLSLMGALMAGEGAQKRPVSRLSAMLSLAALLCVIKFFPVHDYILLLAALAFLWTVYLLVSKKVKLNAIHYVSVFALALTVFFRFGVDRSDRYFILNLKYSVEQSTDFITWDKYSWMLYLDERADESLQASEKALSIAQRVDADKYWLDLIDGHGVAIRDKTWERYH